MSLLRLQLLISALALATLLALAYAPRSNTIDQCTQPADRIAAEACEELKAERRTP